MFLAPPYAVKLNLDICCTSSPLSPLSIFIDFLRTPPSRLFCLLPQVLSVFLSILFDFFLGRLREAARKVHLLMAGPLRGEGGGVIGPGH